MLQCKKKMEREQGTSKQLCMLDTNLHPAQCDFNFLFFLADCYTVGWGGGEYGRMSSPFKKSVLGGGHSAVYRVRGIHNLPYFQSYLHELLTSDLPLSIPPKIN